jgi:type I restriction enzyme M protein
MNFQVFISNLIGNSHSRLLESKEIYSDAEDLLLSELGLKDWQPPEETIAVKSFAESYLVSDRLDAEYYQPKFDQLIERLEEKIELTRLGNLLMLNQKGRQPSYIEEDEKIEGCLPVINSKYVREGEVLLTDNRYAPLPEGNNPLTIQKNDVLFNGTGVGTVGRCAPYFYEQEALPDTEVTVLRTNLLDPVYLSIYLNSIAGKLQVQKHLQGTSGIIRVYPSDIAQFMIWNAPKLVQQKIRDKVEESHQKREQSKQLLEIAKTGVEEAIETDEAIATDWMNQQLEALDINLATTQ